jgi:putative exporter of polyketide antibiotics
VFVASLPLYLLLALPDARVTLLISLIRIMMITVLLWQVLIHSLFFPLLFLLVSFSRSLPSLAPFVRIDATKSDKSETTVTSMCIFIFTCVYACVCVPQVCFYS